MQILKLDIIESGIRTLMAMLCQLIYPLISFLYTLFMNISKVNILSAEEVKPIYQRVTLILTIVMVFYITFEFVKFIVQPDRITDKEKGAGNIIYKMIIVVVLIAFVPTIFTWAFSLQTKIVDKGIIGKVIIGNTGEDTSKFGSNFSANIFSMFYSVPSEYKDEKCGDIECGTLVAMNIGTLANRGELTYLTKGLNETIEEDTMIEDKKAEVPLIKFTFNGFLAVIVGGMIVWILAMYCIDVGVRWAQMIYLQIIAPIPIIGYLSPKKDGIFQKWCKQCLTTYIDLFLRIAIIYFILLLCSILMESRLTGDLLTGIEATGLMETLIYVALILGVMMFAKKAPKMLQELFPSMGSASGNFGLSGKGRGINVSKGLKGAGRVFGAAAGGAVGAVVGAGAGLAQGWRRSKSLNEKTGKAKGVGAGIFGATKGVIGGAIGGAGRGVINGGKKGNMMKNVAAGTKSQIKASQRFGNREENGYGLKDRIGDKAKSAFGARSRSEMLDDKKSPLDRKIKEHDAESKFRKTISDKAFDNAVTKGKGTADARVNAAVNKYNTLQQREKDLEQADSALRQEYKVGKVKHDNASRMGYSQKLNEKNNAINSIDINQIKNTISNDSLGLDKNQFKKRRVEKEYDPAAHEAAKANYMKDSSIIAADGKPIKMFDKEAWEKDQGKFVKDKVIEEFDQNAYNAAVENAKNSKAEEIKQQQVEQIEQQFNSDIQQFLYSSQSEADEAQAKELNEVRTLKKKAKDEVSFAYEDWALQGTNDQELQDLTHAREEENRLYNLDASSDNRISREEQIREQMEKIARERIATSSGRNANTITDDEVRQEVQNVSRAQAEDEWLKKVSNAAKRETEDKVRNIAREQEKIKRQTAGSETKK